VPKSYVDQKTDLMNQLLWTNFLRQWVSVEVTALLVTIPWAGPFLASVWSLKPVQDLILWLLDKEIVWKLFYIMVRWGVFTSIDWQEDAIYSAYEARATELLKVIADPRGIWTPEQDKAFSDAAFDLIEFHIPK
jgi:hypothetical protein